MNKVNIGEAWFNDTWACLVVGDAPHRDKVGETRHPTAVLEQGVRADWYEGVSSYEEQAESGIMRRIA